MDGRLHGIMKTIHAQCLEMGDSGDGFVNYVKGANLAGYTKIATAMLAYGIV